MKRVHRRLVRASHKLRRKAARKARRAHRAQRRAKRKKAREARRARRKKKAAKLKKMFAWTHKERKKRKKTTKKRKKKASWKLPSVKGLFGKKKKKKKTKGKGKKKKKKKKKTKTKGKKKKKGKRHAARKAKRNARRAARRARQQARKQARTRAKARKERMHKRVRKLKRKLARKDHQEKQRKARKKAKKKKKKYVPPRKPKRPEGHARPMKKVPKPPKVDHHVYGKNYISKKFMTKSKSHTRRRRWVHQADSKKAKKDTKRLVGDLQHPVLKKKVSARKKAAAKKKAKKSAKKFFKAIDAKNHPGPPKKMPIPMPAKAYKRNTVLLHPKHHPLHPMRNPVSGGASEASTIISQATAAGVLMVSDALINASKNGKEYIKIDGAKYLRKDLDPGKKIICEHWKIRNAASVCESYRTAHAARKAKKEKAQAKKKKKKKHSVRRPAYGHQHRNADRHGKVSGKPRNLGQWFNHQLQSNKPLQHHRIKKSKKKKTKRSHRAGAAAHKRKKKSKREARLKRSLKKAQAAELLATHTLAAARKRERVSKGVEFEGDDMLHDLMKAQVLLHRH